MTKWNVIFKTEILLCTQRKYVSKSYQINIMNTFSKVYNCGEKIKNQKSKPKQRNGVIFHNLTQDTYHCGDVRVPSLSLVSIRFQQLLMGWEGKLFNLEKIFVKEIISERSTIQIIHRLFKAQD